MKYPKYKIKINIIILIAFFVGCGMAQAISITPSVIEFRAKPGEMKEFKIKLKNNEKSDICFKLDVEAIKKMNSDGSPVFDTITASRMIAPWFSIKENNICAKSGETINFTLAIKIPDNAKPAGYYAAAYFSSLPNAAETGSAVVNRIGILVAIRVDGTIIQEQAKISQFIFDGINKKFIIDFTNDGTVHLRPYGEIIIKTNTGKAIDNLPFNEAGVLVLPASTRHFEILWDNRLYESAVATIEILYGTGPKKALAAIALEAQAPKTETNNRLMVFISLIAGAIILGYIIKKIRRNNY